LQLPNYLVAPHYMVIRLCDGETHTNNQHNLPAGNDPNSAINTTSLISKVA